MKQNKSWSKEEAFDKSRQGANKTFKFELIDIIKQTKNLQNNQIHIVYMDKNHPPNGGIEAATSIIDENMPTGV
jgi:hypothetical protein